MTKVYIGLGSNLGDRVQILLDAQHQLAQFPFVIVTRCSSLYVSSPVGALGQRVDQPNFINAVLELKVRPDCDVRILFLAMQEIEHNLGRVRDLKNRNAARTIDLDLLVFGAEIVSDEDLIVPHPRIGERLFVLRPLAELDKQLQIPGLGAVSQILANGTQRKVYNGQVLHKLVAGKTNGSVFSNSQ